jgi:iron complex transport system ATP-binding protein
LSGKRILDGGSVSFEIKSGEAVGLLGPNGSGKSTLIRAILGLTKKTGGKILYANEDVAALDPKQKARLFAHVPQNTSLKSPFTVLESVVMGRYPYMKRFERYGDHDRELAVEAIARVGLAGFENRIVTTLSGGESAMVAIARSLAQDAPVMLMDEPMSSLDPKHALAIAGIIGELARDGRIILIAIHDVNMALNCAKRLILLRKGMIAGDIYAHSLDEKTLEKVYDIPWEIWSSREGSRTIAFPR